MSKLAFLALERKMATNKEGRLWTTQRRRLAGEARIRKGKKRTIKTGSISLLMPPDPSPTAQVTVSQYWT